jgi:hypothetical protein
LFDELEDLEYFAESSSPYVWWQNGWIFLLLQSGIVLTFVFLQYMYLIIIVAAQDFVMVLVLAMMMIAKGSMQSKITRTMRIRVVSTVLLRGSCLSICDSFGGLSFDGLS